VWVVWRKVALFLQKITAWASAGRRARLLAPIALGEALATGLRRAEIGRDLVLARAAQLMQKVLSSMVVWKLALRLTQTSSDGGSIDSEVTAVAVCRIPSFARRHHRYRGGKRRLESWFSHIDD